MSKPLRVVSWNIENLAPRLGEEEPSLTDLARRLGQPDILCLQEVRIRPVDTPLVERMRVALPGYVCHASLNRDPHNGGFRGGRAYGVATYVRRSLKPLSLVFDWDHEGRVCVSHLPAFNLAVVNVYAVNGTSRAHFDMERQHVHGDRNAFKQAFIERLGRELGALQDHGVRLLVIGDWNISRTRLDTTPRLRTEEPHATARRRFNEAFVGGLDLVDVLREREPEARHYTWFNRRSRGPHLDAARVDFALVSRDLSHAVADTGIEPGAQWRTVTDHSPLWLTLRRPALRAAQPSPARQASKRASSTRATRS